METPLGLDVHAKGLVCKLNKSLYGFKQASRQWYAKLSDALNYRGYTHSLNDYSLFYKKNGSSVVFIAVYVDNIILIGTNLEEINHLKSFLHNQFKIKDLGRLYYFEGLKILYNEAGVLISQRKFVLDLLKRVQLFSVLNVTSPLDATEKLKAKEGKPISDASSYRKLAGKLNFLTNT